MAGYTHQEVKEYIESFGYELISKEYKNNRQKLTVKCPEGHITEVTFDHFKRGSRCRECMPNKRKSIEEIRNFMATEGYELLSSEYRNSKQKLEIKCPKGHVYKQTWREFQAGYRCSECGGTKRKSYEEVKEYIEKEGYTLLSKEYINNSTNLDMLCPQGHKYNANFNNFKKGYRCKKCAGLETVEFEYVKEYLFEQYNYTYIGGEYKNAKSELLIKCDKGHEFTTNWNKIQQGKCHCRECYNEYWYNKEKEYANKYGFEIINKEYANMQTKIKFKCSKGHIFKKTFNAFKSNKSCPYCSASSGEYAISLILDKLRIDGIFQHTFPNCKDVQVLPFDFYLPQYNLIIEYDGKQHFEIVPQFDGEEGFIKRIIHDAIKNQYCEDNNINILRIPFWEFDNIEELITNKLKSIQNS